MYGGYERGNPEADLGSSGYDPQYAKEQLSAAGYPDCKGFPVITVEVTEREVGTYLRQMLSTTLGCPQNRINLRQVEPAQLYRDIKPGSLNRPQMFLSGWA